MRSYNLTFEELLNLHKKLVGHVECVVIRGNIDTSLSRKVRSIRGTHPPPEARKGATLALALGARARRQLSLRPCKFLHIPALPCVLSK